jgi:Uma2 family endonuclease
MSSVVLETPVHPDDQGAFTDRRGCEFIDGQWMEKNRSFPASRVAVNVTRIVDNYALAHDLGLVFNARASYQIFPHKPTLIRKPDGSFIRRDRIPQGGLPRGHAPIHPDLAMEVVSPNDLAEDIEERITDYLLAGVPLVWVIYPKTRTVYVYRSNGNASRLTVADELSGEDVIAGFKCRMEELFAGLDLVA